MQSAFGARPMATKVQLAITGVVLAVGGTAQAALVGNFATPSFPATGASAVYVTNSTSFAESMGSNLTQTFQVSNDFTLDKFYIRYNQARVGEVLNVDIFRVADVNASTLVPGASVLGPVSVTVGSEATTGSTVTNAEFDLTGTDEVALAATTGTAGYGIRITSADHATDTGNDLFWYRTTAPVYDNGTAYRNTAPVNSSTATRDFSLALVAVPEPTGLAAVTLAAAGLLARRRRSKPAC